MPDRSAASSPACAAMLAGRDPAEPSAPGPVQAGAASMAAASKAAARTAFASAFDLLPIARTLRGPPATLTAS